MQPKKAKQRTISYGNSNSKENKNYRNKQNVNSKMFFLTAICWLAVVQFRIDFFHLHHFQPNISPKNLQMFYFQITIFLMSNK